MLPRSRPVLALLLFALVALWARAARADEGPPPDVVLPSPLSLDEALRILDARGLDLLIADAAVMTAQGNAQTAAAVPNPQISASDGPVLNYVTTGNCSGCARQNLSWGVGDNGAILAEAAGKRGLRVESETPVPIVWDGIRMEVGFRADLIVEQAVLLELKSVDALAPVHKKQTLTYLRLANLKVGLLMNFNAVMMKDGIYRIVNGLEE